MSWLDRYQFFLFDFDGLLVNTEHLHKLAYERLAREVGHELNWDFSAFCAVAHRNAEGPKNYFFQQFPDLKERFESWTPLYERKCSLYEQILHEGMSTFMPGAQHLLRALDRCAIPRAVVTNSRAQHVQLIREQLPELNSVPHWITREGYPQPKPHPAAYLHAIERFGGEAQEIVGFEDTPRGLNALRQTSAQPVMVCAADYPLLNESLADGVLHLTSLEQILVDDAL